MVGGRWSVVGGRMSLVVGRWSDAVGRWSLVGCWWSLVGVEAWDNPSDPSGAVLWLELFHHKLIESAPPLRRRGAGSSRLIGPRGDAGRNWTGRRAAAGAVPLGLSDPRTAGEERQATVRTGIEK